MNRDTVTTPAWITTAPERVKDGGNGIQEKPSAKYKELKQAHQELRRKYIKLVTANRKLKQRLSKGTTQSPKEKEPYNVEYDDDLALMKEQITRGDLLQ